MKNIINVTMSIVLLILAVVLFSSSAHAANQKEVDTAVDMALPLVAKFESFSPTWYLCPKGVKTIGYGDTRWHGATITEPQARKLLRERLLECDRVVSKYVTRQITIEQRASLISLIYNIGEGAFRQSTLLKKINQGDTAATVEQMRKWVYTGKTKLRGLVIRREREIALAGW